QEVERLEREVYQQERAWQPQQEILEQQKALLLQSILALRKEQEERAHEQQKVSAAMANARKMAADRLEPLLQERHQLLAAYQTWKRAQEQRTKIWQNAQAELTYVRSMGRLKRFFSEYAR